MSTKIFNGYKLPPLSFLELQEFVRGFQRQVREEGHNLYSKLLVDIATTHFDLATLGKGPEDNDATAAYLAWNEIAEKQRKIEKTGLRDPAFDFHCEICFIPFEDCILAILFTEQQTYTEIWESLPEVESYGYWNNTDPPDDVTDEEWKEREKKWDEALGEFYIPATAAFTIQCLGKYESLDGDWQSELDQFAVPFKDRVRKHAHDKFFTEYMHKRKSEEDDEDDSTFRFMEGLRAFSDWLENEGKEIFEAGKEEIAAILKPKLTKADLCTTKLGRN